MPDTTLATLLARVSRRWQLRAVAFAIAIGGVVFGVLLVLDPFGTLAPATARLLALVIGAAAAALAATRPRRLSTVDAALAIERTSGPLDNLVVTAAELDARPRPVRADIRDEIDRQVAARLGRIDVTRVVPLGQPVIVAAVVVAGCALLASVSGRAPVSRVASAPLEAAEETIGVAHVKVTVSPPAYARRGVEVFADPVQIAVLAGSRVRVEASGRTIREWVASASEGLEIRAERNAEPRFLSVLVVPDAPPQLRIVTPGEDLALAKPAGTIAIDIESRDDLGLASLSLRFTKASGGGENVAFTEGAAPLTLARRSDQQWTGRATLSLDSLGLADGDIVVYRAVARDTNPQGAPVQSDQYLIEIGKNSEIADAGFALPAEEKKYAISQQMVIYKTEQLLKGRYGPDQTRAIAIEQRMVRAETVFLGGGEVEDELEEAARSDELTEGRLQNTGRAELLVAINAMSRAEAQLNDGRAAAALVFERQALASLERALDRRRYFLRTMPDRSRIDVGRRLTGARDEARPWLRDVALPDVPPIVNTRRVMRELAAAAAGEAKIDAGLAARVAAIDPAAPELQKAAVAIASAATANARRDAVQAAMRTVTAHALTTLPSSAAIPLGADPHAGMLADELKKSGTKR